MSRFYVRPDSVQGDRIYLQKEESHHVIDVMRLKEGDAVTAFDGTGAEYRGTIDSAENKKVVIAVRESKAASGKRPMTVSLAQAIPKKDTMDLIVQKATELGAEVILPMESARTIVRTKGERRKRKIERWHKKAVEASKQCGRNTLPDVKDIIRFSDLVKSLSSYDLVIIPCLTGKRVSLKSLLRKSGKAKNVLAMIGPEGGFTENEIAQAEENGAVPVSLGGFTLKSDTAAIATLAVLNHEYMS